MHSTLSSSSLFWCHNPRTLYSAQSKGINAFDAQDIQQRAGVNTHGLEYLAQVKSTLDLYILNTTAKYPEAPTQTL
jgi:vancomycin permeability regulator SanA